ncbi:MAG: pyridoxamine 5'-phosphate oxidase family protein [Acidimicrobiia bacterium]|nr:pyridoxamine 5'-phosphate oxidase family protein [Acidimicrobiia bacterium]
MPRMAREQIDERLAQGGLMAILSVSRVDKGPIAVPLAFLWQEGRFLLMTPPDSVHGKHMRRTGRATVTIHYERLEGKEADEWYVTAEGPIEFIDRDAMALARTLLTKDRGPEHAGEWLEDMRPALEKNWVAALTPARISGFTFGGRLP